MNANPINIGEINPASKTETHPSHPSHSSHSPSSDLAHAAAHAAALAHAERSYPDSARPKSPSHAKLYDQEKYRCYTQRLLIEKEREAEKQSQEESAAAKPLAQSVVSSEQKDSTSELLNHSKTSVQTVCSEQPEPLICAVDAPRNGQPPVLKPLANRSPHVVRASARPLSLPANPSHPASANRAPTKPESEISNSKSEIIPESEPSPTPSSPLPAPQKNQPTTSPSIPDNPHANDPVFHYMIKTNPAFRARHEALEAIRARLKAAHQQSAPTSASTSSSEPPPPAPTNSLEIDPAAHPETEAFERYELTRYLDLRSHLDHLPPERRRLLYDLVVDYGPYRTSEILALPEPEGWGLKASPKSLTRFRERYSLQLGAIQQRENEKLARDLLANPTISDADLNHATERLFKTRLFQAINDPKQSAGDLRHYLHSYTRLRALDLAAQRLALQSQNPAELTSSKPNLV